MFQSREELEKKLAEHNYLIDRNVATVVFLAVKLQKPLLVEGPAGSAKQNWPKPLQQPPTAG